MWNISLCYLNFIRSFLNFIRLIFFNFIKLRDILSRMKFIYRVEFSKYSYCKTFTAS